MIQITRHMDGRTAVIGATVTKVPGDARHLPMDEYRVWPDGTVQEASEPPYSWLSDDYLMVRAEDEAAALAKADRAYPREA